MKCLWISLALPFISSNSNRDEIESPVYQTGSTGSPCRHNDDVAPGGAEVVDHGMSPWIIDELKFDGRGDRGHCEKWGTERNAIVASAGVNHREAGPLENGAARGDRAANDVKVIARADRAKLTVNAEPNSSADVELCEWSRGPNADVSAGSRKQTVIRHPRLDEIPAETLIVDVPARGSSNSKAEPLIAGPGTGDRQHSIWKNRADADQSVLIIDVGPGGLPGPVATGGDRNEDLVPVGKNNHVLTWQQPYVAMQAIHAVNGTVHQRRGRLSMDCLRHRGDMLTRSEGNEVSFAGSSSRYFEMEIGAPERPNAEIKHHRKQAVANTYRRTDIRPEEIGAGIRRIEERDFYIVQAIGWRGAVVKSALICERSALSTKLRDDHAMAQETDKEEQF